MIDAQTLKDILAAKYDVVDLVEMLEIDSNDLVEAFGERIEDEQERLGEIIISDENYQEEDDETDGEGGSLWE